jgi:hypothetical protein
MQIEWFEALRGYLEQINLATAFLAAGVVGMFETIAQSLTLLLLD